METIIIKQPSINNIDIDNIKKYVNTLLDSLCPLENYVSLEVSQELHCNSSLLVESQCKNDLDIDPVPFYFNNIPRAKSNFQGALYCENDYEKIKINGYKIKIKKNKSSYIINHDLEIERRTCFKILKKIFINILKNITELDNCTIKKIYIMWIYNQYAEGYNTFDPVIPLCPTNYQYFDLIELIKYNIIKNKSKVIIDYKQNLYKFNKIREVCKILINNILNFSKKINYLCPQKNSPFFGEVIKKNMVKNNTLIEFFIDKKYMCSTNINTYDKLMNQINVKYDGNKDYLIICLLYRYLTIGIDNNHAAVTDIIKDEYSKKFDIKIELFAAAFNNYCNIYCSLFYDLEQYFGSIGSFFDIIIEEGSFFCNPPFIEKLMDITSENLIKFFKNSNHNIIIIYTIPIWNNFNSLDILEANKQFIIYKNKYEKNSNNFIYYHHYDDKYYNLTDTYFYILSNSTTGNSKDVPRSYERAPLSPILKK